MIFLIGHGYVGSEIAHQLQLSGNKFVHLNHDYFLKEEIIGLDSKDSIVINAAGYVGTPNVDACEDNKKDCIYGNIMWPLLLEQKCGDTPVIHIGSGCIYNNYSQDYYYTEEDEPNFNGSFYSLCKSFAEELINLSKSYILRIRIPFTSYDHPRNFLTKIKLYDKLINTQNSISSLEDVARVVLFFINQRPKPGIYNCTNPGSITTYGITQLMGIKKQWFSSYEEFMSTVKTGRSNCLLNTEKLERIYKIRPIEDAIIDSIN